MDSSGDIVTAFYQQYNLFKCKFKGVPAGVKNSLFKSYCTSFYGLPLCNLRKLQKLHIAYRKCIRDLWCFPYRTHNRLLPHIAGNICENHLCVKRFASFAHSVTNHECVSVAFLFKNAILKKFSIFGQNVEYLGNLLQCETSNLFEMSFCELMNKVFYLCNNQCLKKHDRIVANAIVELAGMRDGLYTTPLDMQEIIICINELCTN